MRQLFGVDDLTVDCDVQGGPDGIPAVTPTAMLSSGCTFIGDEFKIRCRMASGDVIGGLLLIVTGIGTVYIGHRTRVEDRADLIFSPNTSVSPEDVARIGGFATILGGIATIGLGLTLYFVPPTGLRWFVLLGVYTALCLAIGTASWRRIRNQSD